MPVYGTSAHRFFDLGTNTFFNALFDYLRNKTQDADSWKFEKLPEGPPNTGSIIPPDRVNYLGQIAQSVRSFHEDTQSQAQLAARADGLWRTLQELGDEVPPPASVRAERLNDNASEHQALRNRYNTLLEQLEPETRKAWASLKPWPSLGSSAKLSGSRKTSVKTSPSLSGNAICKVHSANQRLGRPSSLPAQRKQTWKFPHTAGVFPFKRKGEDPTRMFAGEGTPERNRRFHFVSKGQPAVRLSTASTRRSTAPTRSPTGHLGEDWERRFCLFLDDAKRHSGFNLCAPTSPFRDH